jgi:hypothetical protein
MTININKIDEIIKNTKYPLLLIISILYNENISDEQRYLVVKSFFKYHILIGIECDLSQIYNLENTSPLTYNFICDIYYILSKQLSILSNIVKFKKAYQNNKFWKLEINNMIINLKTIHKSFLCLFDASKGMCYFHSKLKGIINKNGYNYHINEMTERLKKTYNMFKMSFFTEYNIVLLSYYQFIDLTFENMIKYTEYIFIKINNIINHTINYLILYDNYRLQLFNILYNTSTIDIDINDVSSDIDPDDIPFILSLHA